MIARQILGPNGQPVTAERVIQEKRSRFNPLRDDGPDVLTRELEAYCRGDIARLCWKMEWLEKHDDTISMVAPKAKGAVARHGWDVAIKDDVTPELKQMAQDQQGRLQRFYGSLTSRHCVEEDEIGGMSLLFRQVMDAHAKGYGAHHIVWQPGTDLTAELTFVPGWFWEVRTGRMRFLQSPWDWTGVERDLYGGPTAWMTTKGRGIMLACAVARMFKTLPLQDWLTYCDRHGMPGFLGKTTAKKGTPEWAALYEAVQGVGSEFSAVVNNNDAIEVLDLTSKGQLPYDKLIERMDRAIVMLWRGADLSTMSRGGSGSVGANPQMQETDELDGDNAEWVGETIDRQLSRRVIDWYFGEGTPQLAELRLRRASRPNIADELRVVESAVAMGVRVSMPWFAGKFGVVEADQDEPCLNAPAKPVVPVPAKPVVPSDGSDGSAVNTKDGDALLKNTLAKALGTRAQYLAPIAPALQRLRTQAANPATSDAAFLALAEDVARELPELLDPVRTDALAKDLQAAMGTAATQGARDALKESTQATP